MRHTEERTRIAAWAGVTWATSLPSRHVGPWVSPAPSRGYLVDQIVCVQLSHGGGDLKNEFGQPCLRLFVVRAYLELKERNVICMGDDRDRLRNERITCEETSDRHGLALAARFN
jgi:hypothetical protein